MPNLVEWVLDALGREDPAEAISLASSLFERSLGNLVGLDRPEVLAQSASEGDVAKVRDRLVELVRGGTPTPTAGAAVFALGKLHDPGLIPFFVEVMRGHLDRDSNVL